MEVLPTLPDASVGLSVYSPPFPELYQYSNDPRDMSNCATYEEGLLHYQFIVSQIHRLTMPGRMTCVHCMDLKKGTMYQNDFPGDIVRAHQEAGFNFVCRVTIWKDPWLIARRTRMRSLMHKTIVEDSSKCRVAGPDYVMMFRKSGENQEPITHKRGFKTYAGETPIPHDLVEKYANFKGDQKKNRMSHWIWRQYASPVWGDIRTGRLMPYIEARENDEEKHVCPLQLDVIERCLTLWSNPGDKVLSPFMGVGSEVYCAVENRRRGIGIELKSTYYKQAVKNLELLEVPKEGTLFD
ncbi:MAG: site-specific DNA-methyltransferase [Chloroflexi bacterium]|nr:site-specific DNA-methyltransferase [Chloroflexota bacterium]